MAPRYDIDDSKWFEVRIINGYALFMGYLMMGVRGLGLLVLGWTTAVLLGGFVSDLREKDFWCLTVIMLLQTAEVFNFLLKEKLRDMVGAWWGMQFIIYAKFADKDKKEEESEETIKAFILSVILGVVVGIILLPLRALVYMFGLYISAGFSLWRLIEHDFGNEGRANMKPSLQVLYSLAVVQGVFFGCITILALGRSKMLLAKLVADNVSMMDESLVIEYLEETVAGCQIDLSFATGRNLVTYGMKLMMESSSNEGFIAGIRVLGGVIKDCDDSGRLVLAKHLLMTRSHSWSHMIRRLLETMGPRSPYSREIREHAARIVALVARSIRLEQFPGAIECVSSLLDTTAECSQQESSELDIERKHYGDELKGYQRLDMLEEYELEYLEYERKSPDSPLSSLKEQLVQFLACKWKSVESERKERRGENTVHGFHRLLTEAVNIIHQLAFDKDNQTRIMSNTKLRHKIAVAPLKLHRDGHTACYAYHKSELQMLEKCWVLIKELSVEVEGSNSQGQPASGGSGGRRGSGDEIQEVQGRLLVSSMLGSGSALEIENNTISNNIKSTIKSIFDCLDCRVRQKKQGIQIILHLSLDLSFLMDSESGTRRLTWILLLIFRSLDFDYIYWMASGFTYGYSKMGDFGRIQRLAGAKLSDMLGDKYDRLPSDRDLQLIRLALGDLTSAFADDTEDISIRTHAAIIMEGLCTGLSRINHPHHSCSETNLKLFEEEYKILVSVIPKVVEEILARCASRREEGQEAHVLDVEEGGISLSQDDCLQSKMKMFPGVYTDEERLRKALVSLCRGGYMDDLCLLRPEFERIASKMCKKQGKSFKYFKSLLFDRLHALLFSSAVLVCLCMALAYFAWP